MMEVSLGKVRLIIVRVVAASLMIKLGRKVKKCLRSKICLSLKIA